ncbi:uncharacterized protein A1O9_09183 [Exophiala aquamarina CBS 119918]|uniref:Major facilitator superfamily (MFS) profile domain-containing protein n=1 Tax=Exophiala aquamarina CBS 119918 TaxID=1182545 RepID=A0A072P4I1_9EURO|nr:uncharacterized protein A1O9_09183 [Exophiala aquamarina CBS 119918]KEF54741.1 hypothetical protein A1O9_09183 [Exophiala aquamarina CBS 119918]
MVGFDMSIVGPLLSLPMFAEKYQGNPGPLTGKGVLIPLQTKNLNLIVTVPIVGAIIASFGAPPMQKAVGRRKTLLWAQFCVCLPSALLQLFAPNLGVLVAGRVIHYVGLGFAANTGPLYLSEIAPAHVRGRLIGFCSVMYMASGILGSTVVWGCEKLSTNLEFQIPLGIQAGLSVFFGLLTVPLFESPQWHALRGDYHISESILYQIRGTNKVLAMAEVDDYRRAFAKTASNPSNGTLFDIVSRENIKRTLISGAYISFEQVSGLVMIGAFSTVTLTQAGVGDVFKVTIFINCLMFAGQLVGPYLVDTMGRRPVALTFLPIIAGLNMAAASLAMAGLEKNSMRSKAVAGVFICLGFFITVAYGSLSWVIQTEIAVLHLREKSVGWSQFWSYIAAIVTSFVVPRLANPDGLNLGARVAYIFAGTNTVALIFTYFCLPETKGRTFAEIQAMYDNDVCGVRLSKTPRLSTSTASRECSDGRLRS